VLNLFPFLSFITSALHKFLKLLEMEKLSLLGRKADPGVFKVESLEDKTERRLKGVYGVE
jgi:hypothetical protein